mmetsp:Transcript_20316/g.26323  ORF Transcript_20316/g.26323 Transcript_20316/m.26323 type:complete len:291 (-) Transcript_20316:212-1084(-)
MVGLFLLSCTVVCYTHALKTTDITQDVGMRAVLDAAVFDETDEVLAGLPDVVGDLKEDQFDVLSDLRLKPTETFDLLVEIQSSVSMDYDAFDFNLDANLRDNFRIAIASVIKRVKSAAAVENIEAGEVDGQTVVSYSVSVPMQGSGQAGALAESALAEIKADLVAAIREGSLEETLHSHNSNVMLHVEQSLRLTDEAIASYSVVRGVPEPSNIAKRSVIDHESELELAEADEARRVLDEDFSFSFSFAEEEESLELLYDQACESKTVDYGHRFDVYACPLIGDTIEHGED